MLTSSYPRHAGDGAGSFVASLARALVRRGHRVIVVAPHDPAEAPMDQGGVLVERFRYAPGDRLCLVGHGRSLESDRTMRRWVPVLMPGYVAAAACRVLAVHRRERLDLLHAHWAVPGGAIAGGIARLTRLPMVTSLHGSDVYVSEHSRLYAAAARWSFRRARWVTACSQDLRQRAMGLGLRPERSSVIPYGVDVERFGSGAATGMRDRLGIPPGALVVGAMGRLVYKKGFEHLIAALPAVLARAPGVYLLIAGDGDLRGDLARQAEHLGQGARTLFPGHIAWEATPDFYALCDVLVVPSVVDRTGNVDGLPNVLLEAMAAGRAVVSSSVGGIPSVVRDGVNGLLVPPGDSGALATALLRLLADASLRGRLGSAARADVETHYRWEDIAARTESVYLSAIAGASGPKG